MTADPSALAAGLREAIRTARDDQVWSSGTRQYQHHIDRVSAMEAAAAFLETLPTPLSRAEEPDA